MFHFSYCKLLSAAKATGTLAQVDSNVTKFKEGTLCVDVLNPGSKSDIFFGSHQGHKI